MWSPPSLIDPSEFTATIDWGDGKVDTGSADGVGVIRDPHGSGVFDVTGGHSFAKPGAYPILVSVADTRAASTAAVTPGSNRGSGPLSPQTNRDLAPRIFNQGETAITVTPAAIGNAIFNATGARLRDLPFTPERVKAALLETDRSGEGTGG